MASGPNDTITEAEAHDKLVKELEPAEEDFRAIFPEDPPNLTEARREALINMCFNMGRPTMLTFHNTILAVRQGEWLRAAAHAQQSLWYRQVGQRARRIVDELRTGYSTDTAKPATTKEPDKPATDNPTTLLGWLRKLLLVRRSNT